MQNTWLRFNEAVHDVHDFQQVLIADNRSVNIEKNENENENEENGIRKTKGDDDRGGNESITKGVLENHLYSEIISNLHLFRELMKNEKVQLFLNQCKIKCFDFEEKMILLEYMKTYKYMLFMISKIFNVSLIDTYEQFHMSKEEYDVNVSNLFINILKVDKIFEKDDEADEVGDNDNMCNDNDIAVQSGEKGAIFNSDLNERIRNRGDDTTNAEKDKEKLDRWAQKKQLKKINECDEITQKEELQTVVRLQEEKSAETKEENKRNLNGMSEQKKKANEIEVEPVEHDFLLNDEKQINLKNIIDFINEENKMKINILNDKIKYLQKEMIKYKKELQDSRAMKISIENYQNELSEKNKVINNLIEERNEIKTEKDLIQSQLDESVKENKEYSELQNYCKEYHIDKQVIIEIIKTNQMNFKNSNIQNQVFLILCDILGIKHVILGLTKKNISEQFLEFLDEETKDD